METYDIGSLPFEGDFDRFQRGAVEDPLLALLHASAKGLDRLYFEDRVLKGYIDKVQAGIDIPVYPQFRDMNQMFFDMLAGFEKKSDGYLVSGAIRVRPDKAEIPEVAVLRNNAKLISEITGKPMRLKVCVTGPYTLASLLADRQPDTFTSLAGPISKIVDANIFKTKYGQVEIISVEEPSFGLLDDPNLDFGGAGRDSLLRAWENVFSSAKRRDVRTAYHLHSTADGLFWEVKAADIVESHVDDILYRSPKTKALLERSGKVLKASIAVTSFDTLIRCRVAETEKGSEAEVNERVGLAWSSIGKGLLSPHEFLETVDIMRMRLREVIKAVGAERVAYAGPECGLRSFPSYDSALELLRRTSTAAHLD